ncbi:hypothetical protein ACNOYE_13875 [Nannocystaceae bacterium ST9]
MFDKPQTPGKSTELPNQQTLTSIGAREIDVEELGKLFQLETLAPPGEANGMSCCVILCKVG